MGTKIVIWTAILFGAVIGWIVSFFIRKYHKYTEKTLSSTAKVFGTGCIFSSLSFLYDTPTGTMVLLYYALGCAIGFFMFWIYQFIVSFAFRSKFTRVLDQYLLFSSCDVEASSAMHHLEQLTHKADRLTAGYKLLSAGNISLSN